MTAGRRSVLHFESKVSVWCANASTQTFSSNIEKTQNKTKIKKKKSKHHNTSKGSNKPNNPDVTTVTV